MYELSHICPQVLAATDLKIRPPAENNRFIHSFPRRHIMRRHYSHYLYH
jgi:hypothetical protein